MGFLVFHHSFGQVWVYEDFRSLQWSTLSIGLLRLGFSEL
jgi:hypothetical protein